jgi:hypothetical protein
MRTPPTPSSLKWLINRRTRLAGELEKAKMVASNRLLQEQKDVANAKAVLMKIVDFADKLSQHFGPILSHLVKDKFAYSIVDKSKSLAFS